MKKLFLFLILLVAMFAHASAQVLKGDMNDDSIIDVADINQLISTILGELDIKYVDDSKDDNALIAGTWYMDLSDSFTLAPNGSTNYPKAALYKYIPKHHCILFLDYKRNLNIILNVISLQDGILVVNPYGTDELIRYTSRPVQFVSSISISPSTLSMTVGDQKTLTATVLPSNATNKNVTWSVDKPDVVRLVNNVVYAVSSGEAVITCSASDGSDVKSTCKVVVDAKHEYVNLGLPGGVLWATCNIGADKPEDTGKFFAWGETIGYTLSDSHTFNWLNYTLCNGTSTTMKRYCTNPNYGMCDNISTLNAKDDAATVNWGSVWRMPTYEEINDLYNPRYTTSEWVTVNGVKCRKVTSKTNGNYILLPATGYRKDSDLFNEGSHGYYWTRSLFYNVSSAAYHLDVTSGYMEWSENERFYGQCIRPVRVTP